MKIIAIDPGPVESAYAVLHFVDAAGVPFVKLLEFGKVKNEFLLSKLNYPYRNFDCDLPITVLVIEQVAAMGMAVGAEVFETCVWTGRFMQAWSATRISIHRIKRHEVKMNLCGNMRAKDGNIRQALIDRFGEVGTKKKPGFFYKVSGDVWSAIAVGVTFFDQQ